MNNFMSFSISEHGPREVSVAMRANFGLTVTHKEKWKDGRIGLRIQLLCEDSSPWRIAWMRTNSVLDWEENFGRAVIRSHTLTPYT